MIKKIYHFALFLAFMFYEPYVEAYSLPGVNLGLTNILDGGPVRPNPGNYVIGYFQYYYSHNFLDNNGNKLGCVPSPRFTAAAFIGEYVYQFNGPERLNAQLGVAGSCYLAILRLSKNNLGFRTSGTGFGNLWLGSYLQWNPIFRNGRPLFVHRAEFDVAFPVGKNREPFANINPAANFFFINPYWAATLFFTEDFGMSWRLHYLWCDKNHKTDVQPGQAVHANFCFEYQVIKDWYVALNGYFLKQLTDDKKCGIVRQHSKEQVVALGVGACHFCSKDLIFFANIYDEFAVRNRPQGVNFVLHFLAHF